MALQLFKTTGAAEKHPEIFLLTNVYIDKGVDMIVYECKMKIRRTFEVDKNPPPKDRFSINRRSSSAESSVDYLLYANLAPPKGSTRLDFAPWLRPGSENN